MDIVRAALYIRVSTEEQAREGYSVEAQKDNLVKYAKAKGYSIVDIYVDEGITARKKYTNRKEFMRLLDDVEKGKIDLILFIKLDRWFRSVGDYYKVQEILDKNNVNWATTMENYDTSTANGRLYVNIRLSVAQDESDRTSERIKFVFEKKIADGEVISGSPPFGYAIENKKHVIDEKEEVFVLDMFSTYKRLRSINATCVELNKKYSRTLSYNTYHKVLRKNLLFYAGEYRGNKNYFPPYLSKEEFEEIKSIGDSTTVRNGGNTYDYIFSGLLKCSNCGRSMVGGGSVSGSNGKVYRYYRCSGFRGKVCPKMLRVSESKLEKQLFSRLEAEINRYSVEFELSKVSKRKVPKVNRSSIENKLKRLRKLYINELIEIEDYKTEYDILNKELEELEEKVPEEKEIDFTQLRKLLDSDYKEIYNSLNNLDKRSLWHEVIEEIIMDEKEINGIIFK